MVVIGGSATLLGARYGMGTMAQIGPGFFPSVLGVVLMVLGLTIALTPSLGPGHEDSPGHAAPVGPVDWRGCSAIVGGVLLFIALTPLLGFVPGTFACVFTAAIGDRKMTVLSSAVLAAVVTAAGALLFIRCLRVSLPYFGS